MREIDERQANERAYALISELHGLSIGQALWVLDLAKKWIQSTHSVDANNPALTAAIQESVDASPE